MILFLITRNKIFPLLLKIVPTSLKVKWLNYTEVDIYMSVCFPKIQIKLLVKANCKISAN